MKGFNINSFTQIGLEDPFPDDDKFIKGSLDDVDPKVYFMPQVPTDLVYQKQRFTATSPTCVYIPRKEIMLKLMRAAIEASDVDELWFNRNQ